jgi:methylenetetrahydrofolate dehydrogenase (NADP+) / methenyltetrahydrofolate cyclohydrolase
MNILEPNNAAASHRDTVRSEIARDGLKINVCGILATDDPASITYANYARSGCEDVGISFDLIRVEPGEAESVLDRLNNDPQVHGIFVYYPIWNDARDSHLRDRVSSQKDLEGLTPYWINKLYANERYDDEARRRKAILPCTPLAIVKLLEMTDAYSPGGLPFRGQTIAIFNRSEVVGRPLAYMLTNDGALVYSFDVDGGVVIESGGHGSGSVPMSRREALASADVVITGVPSRGFEKISVDEIKPGAICLNFSSVENFEEAIKSVSSMYIPRVGTMTVAMCMRNALRLYRNYHHRG